MTCFAIETCGSCVDKCAILLKDIAKLRDVHFVQPSQMYTKSKLRTKWRKNVSFCSKHWHLMHGSPSMAKCDSLVDPALVTTWYLSCDLTIMPRAPTPRHACGLYPSLPSYQNAFAWRWTCCLSLIYTWNHMSHVRGIFIVLVTPRWALTRESRVLESWIKYPSASVACQTKKQQHVVSGI